MDNKIKGIILDYGGTIDSPGEHWSEVIRRGWTRAGITCPDDVFNACYVWAERHLGVTPDINPGFDFHRLMLVKAALELEEFARLGHELPIEKDKCAVVIADYCDECARRHIERVRPFLADLADRHPLMLVSNFYGNLDSVTRAFGIRQYFRGVLDSATVGVRKPDPRIFSMAVVALGLDPSDVLAVGDSLHKDIIPAAQTGCRTAWLRGRDSKDSATTPEGTVVLNNLEELDLPN